MAHYKEYVFFPMHLGKIKEVSVAGFRLRMSISFLLVGLQKVGQYQSTREFTHDTEWILHNCTIYNGGMAASIRSSNVHFHS